MHPPDVPASPGRPLDSLMVLLVDDDPALRGVFARLLRQLGGRVSEVSSGDEAVVHLLSNRCDLVISDQHMPGMSGLELLQELRTSDPSSRTRFILQSGDVDPGLAAMVRALGGAVLRKPSGLADLIRAVHESSEMRVG